MGIPFITFADLRPRYKASRGERGSGTEIPKAADISPPIARPEPLHGCSPMGMVNQFVGREDGIGSGD